MPDYEIDAETQLSTAPWMGKKMDITKVIIENGVTNVGNGAFHNLENAASVSLPNGLTTIGDRAFENLAKLSGINIPETVTSISANAFDGCTNLPAVPDVSILAMGRIDALWWVLPRAGNFQINGTGAMPDFLRPNDNPWKPPYTSKIGSISMDNGVTSIGNFAFYFCENVTSVNIPEGVTRIGTAAFVYCRKLTNVTIPASTAILGGSSPSSIASVFNGCYGLTNIDVAAGNPAFTSEDGVLFSADKKSLILYPASNTQSTYSIPSSVITVGMLAFDNSTRLTNVTIPESVTKLNVNAFANCTGLTSVTLPASVNDIESGAFAGCINLIDVTCLATTPPIMQGPAFQTPTIAFPNIIPRILHVPAESIELYKASSWKGYFKSENIVAI